MGSAAGSVVGSAVGRDVGSAVGSAVGSDVGSAVAHPQTATYQFRSRNTAMIYHPATFECNTPTCLATMSVPPCADLRTTRASCTVGSTKRLGIYVLGHPDKIA